MASANVVLLQDKTSFSPCAFDHVNEVYGGAETSVGIFLHRSGDDAVVKREQKQGQG